MVAVPEWAQELFRAKGIEQVTRAEVVKDTAFHKLVIGYTPTSAVLAEKSLLGTAAYLLPAPVHAPPGLALPPADAVVEGPKEKAKAKKAKAKAKPKAPRGQVQPRPRKAKRAAPAPAPEPADEPGPPAPEPALPEAAPATFDLDETRTLDAVPGAAPAAHDLAPELEAEVPPAPASAPPAIPGAGHREGDFTLYARQQNGRPFYFFARGTPKSGEAAAMPEGYEVAWNERTRTPFLRRKK